MKLKQYSWTISAMAISAMAVANDEPITVSGFGTFGVSHTMTNQADYRTRIEQIDGVGHSGDIDLGSDSLLAAQVAANVNDKIMGFGQVVSRKKYVGDYTPGIEAGFVRYKPIDEVSLRAGRMMANTFFDSESMNVGFSQTWIHAPANFYLLNPVSSIDGGSVTLDRSIAGWRVIAEASYGISGQKVYLSETDVSDLKYRNAIASLAVEKGSHMVRLMTWNSTAKVTNSNQILETYTTTINKLANEAVPNARYISDQMDFLNPISGNYYGLGYRFDQAKYQLQSEMIVRNVAGSAVQDAKGAYALASYKAGEFTPFVLYSKVLSGEDSTLPHVDSPEASLINYMVDVMNTRRSSTIYSWGTKLNIQKDLDAKMQFDYVFKPINSYPDVYVKANDEWIKSNKVSTILTASVDYVF